MSGAQYDPLHVWVRAQHYQQQASSLLMLRVLELKAHEQPQLERSTG